MIPIPHRLCAGILLALFLLGVRAGSAAAAWSITTFDPTANAGWAISLDIGAAPGVVDDLTGTAHISYWTAGAGFRYYDGITSTPTGSLAPGVPDETELIQVPVTALALDSGNEPWIAQARLDGNNGSKGELTVTHRSGGVWTNESMGTVSGAPTMAYDRLGGVLHLFCATPTGPVYAWRDGGGWHSEPFDTTNAYGVLRLDRSGRPCLAYFTWPSGHLYFAQRAAGVWQSQPVTGVSGTQNCDLAFNGLGQPRIAYLLASGEVRHAEENLGAWSTETILPAGSTAYDFALAIGGGDHPYLAYHDGALDQLWVAIRTAGVWSAEVVDPQVGAGAYVAMEFNGAWEPVIAYKANYGTGARIARGSAIIGVDDPPSTSRLALRGPWPNPARAGDGLAFTLTSPRADLVRIEAYDVAGRAVATAQAFAVQAGLNRIEWSGRLRAGLVFLRAVTSRGEVARSRVVVLD